ncbi:hydroxylamine reductase [Fontisphaera persica]|uniref:hydroxylamine reductase n=1 Tax=Fontisphaera persica TaxID=2974023 RepID=UPI0024BF6F56|nr:hydroxylamine reductase [Fontisphaera persica]WCJ58932.1 hydroxylamine reductase [Fontisphaera persica]
MFCYQCEQTSRGVACQDFGVCGKDEHSAALQDLIVHVVKGIAQYAHRARQLGAADRAVDVYIVEALFSTVTNVNFDSVRLNAVLGEGLKIRERARQLYVEACQRRGQAVARLNGATQWVPALDAAGQIRQAQEVGIEARRQQLGADVAGLQELLLYGVKGTAAYADHALILGQEDPAVFAFFAEALDYLCEPQPAVPELLRLCLKCGEVNLRVMELLDAANTGAYGHPVPTPVRITPVKGKCILVSGHDLKDLEELLKQTEGKGINIYTHGEMLPAHGYPGLKKYKHLVGNFGGAWQDQAVEFQQFPGAILMTTNCIQRPVENYRDRLFTCGLVAWPGVRHIRNRDFSPVIEAALAAPGFTKDEPEKTILVGFGHQTVMSVADKVIAGVKSGAIKRFFLIGGCDGARSGRDYYTELAERVPSDCVILTLACGKYRFNKMDFGAIDGIPRLLDMGQCNDAYSAIKVAQALAGAFNCGVNDLPLSLVLSWYEQKAVAILLTLLHLGIKNIRLGPTLPAFVSPAVLQVLVEQFQLHPITRPADDLKAIMA